MKPILINAERFVSMYFPDHKIKENAKEIRIGNKGSKVVMKDGSGFFDHEEGNFTSMFNEIIYITVKSDAYFFFRCEFSMLMSRPRHAPPS